MNKLCIGICYQVWASSYMETTMLDCSICLFSVERKSVCSRNGAAIAVILRLRCSYNAVNRYRFHSTGRRVGVSLSFAGHQCCAISFGAWYMRAHTNVFFLLIALIKQTCQFIYSDVVWNWFMNIIILVESCHSFV